MNDEQFERELRAAAERVAGGPAPRALHARVAAVTTNYPRRSRRLRSVQFGIELLGVAVAIAVVVSGAALLIATRPQQNPGLVGGTASPATPSPASAGPVSRQWGDLTFLAPADWQIVAPHVWAMPTGPRLFMSNASIADPCPSAFLGDQCLKPLAGLPPNGILVTVSGIATLIPRDASPQPTEYPVGGGTCKDLKGDREIAVVVQNVGLTACLRGPDLDSNRRAFETFFGSLRRASASPNNPPPPQSPVGIVVGRTQLPSVPLGPLWITVADGAPWVALGGSPQGEVERIDPVTDQVTQQVKVGWAPGSLAAFGTSLWVSNTSGDGSEPHSPYLNTVQRIDTTTGRIVETVPIELPGQLVADATGAWVISAQHSLVHVSMSGQVLGSVALAAGSPSVDLPVSVAAAGGRIWVVLAHGGASAVTLEAINPAAMRIVLTSDVPQAIGWLVPTPTGLFGAQVTGTTTFLWTRIDLQTGQAVTLGQFPVRPAQFEGVAVTTDGAWLLDGDSSADFGEVIPFDPATGAQTGPGVMPPTSGAGSMMVAIGRDVWLVGSGEVEHFRF